MTQLEFEQVMSKIEAYFPGFRVSVQLESLWERALIAKNYPSISSAIDSYAMANRNKPIINDILSHQQGGGTMFGDESKRDIMYNKGKVVVWDKRIIDQGLPSYYANRSDCVGIKYYPGNDMYSGRVRFVYKAFLMNEMLTGEEQGRNDSLDLAIKRFGEDREGIISRWGWDAMTTEREQADDYKEPRPRYEPEQEPFDPDQFI